MLCNILSFLDNLSKARTIRSKVGEGLELGKRGLVERTQVDDLRTWSRSEVGHIVTSRKWQNGCHYRETGTFHRNTLRTCASALQNRPVLARALRYAIAHARRTFGLSVREESAELLA